MTVKITILGVPQLKAYLGRLGHNIMDNTSEATKKAAFYVEGEVKQSIAGYRAEKRSVDTGHFMRSVQSNMTGKYTAEVKSDVSYAKYLEFGTTRISARRHFQNTKSRARETIRKFYLNAIKDAI